MRYIAVGFAMILEFFAAKKQIQKLNKWITIKQCANIIYFAYLSVWKIICATPLGIIYMSTP